MLVAGWIGCAPNLNNCELLGDVRASNGQCMRTTDASKRCRRDCIAGAGAAKECLDRCNAQQLTREHMCAQSLIDACDTLRRTFAFLFATGEEWRGEQTCGDTHDRFTLVTRSLDADRSTFEAELDTGKEQARYEGGYDPASGILHLRATLPKRTAFPPFELAGYLMDETPRKVVGSTGTQCKIEFERTLR